MSNFLKQNAVPFISGLILPVLFYFLAQGSPGPDGHAKSQVKKYRKLGLRRGHGEYYDSLGLRAYLENLPQLIKKVDLTDSGGNNSHSFNGHKLIWEIGFYWKMGIDSLDKNKTKHALCMIPTLVDTNINGGQDHPLVFDYFDDTEKFYNHKNDESLRYKILTTVAADASNAYDNGQLWP